MSKKFDSDYQPKERRPRGKSFNTKLIEALGRIGKTEDEFIDLLVDKAINEGGIYLTELMKRTAPVHKPTYAPVKFEFNPESSPVEKADLIMSAVASGDLTPDVGSLLIEAISKMLGIEEVTDLAKRLEALEQILKDKDA